MKKTALFLPIVLVVLLVSAAVMAGAPAMPYVATRSSVADEDKPKEPKRIFDRRIAWGPLPEETTFIEYQQILSRYGE
ncbi:hypothetical protein [Parapedobacter koreensis]|uniref:Uncharacterized protein n=1 Tax=Parapedobacter koreensis TaxID=332977 RepID=A0A1H7MEK0_9SPHI|nr:hypothetical protein [Parapedobacter koreensis]SEL09499.1 hypothetical protein SAMN05421740_103480 [Parapedobacter koreensis]